MRRGASTTPGLAVEASRGTLSAIDGVMHKGYRTQATAPLPAETERIGPPGRRLPSRLSLALVVDGTLWWPVLSAPLIVVAQQTQSAWLLALAGILTLAAVALLMARRQRLPRLLRRGVVAAASLVERSPARFGHTEEVRARMLPGWQRVITTYEGPILRNVLRVGLPAGPFVEVVRQGGEWDEDLCLFDPHDPRRHVFLADLPPFVHAEPQRGWLYAAPRSAPTGSIGDVVLGAAGALFCGGLALVALALAAALAWPFP
ncbi:MAG: hypothetical protein IT378_14620 [Sandaracinaceae bacterium]|nr:hypothetical protein [Sandaracinaceae bacterium]